MTGLRVLVAESYLRSRRVVYGKHHHQFRVSHRSKASAIPQRPAGRKQGWQRAAFTRSTPNQQLVILASLNDAIFDRRRNWKRNSLNNGPKKPSRNK